MPTETKNEPSLIGLPEAIEQLRQDLAKAIQDGAQHPVRFHAKSIELELTLGFSRDLTAKTGIRAWVFELGGDGRIGQTGSHKITLQLELAGDGLVSGSGVGGVGDKPETRGQK